MMQSLKKLAASLSAKQILGLAAAFLAVVAIVVGSAYFINTPSYALLAADLDAESAGALVTKLKDAKVPYALDAGGRTIRVPAERLDELRLQFATDGLPAGGRLGFEIFDRPAFGTTEFLEHVNYRRALEGELARTISTLSEVSSARVHIAMAKDSLFTDRDQPAKASVVLRLKANRQPPVAVVRGIAGLVASSVESLRPESVVILDAYGRSLTRAEEDEGEATGLQLDRQMRIERDLTGRVIAMLEPVIGEGRVRANISVRLKADAEEETEERWDPTSVVRSRQTQAEGDLKTGSQGIAGARANLPPNMTTSPAPAAATPVTTAQGLGRTSETTNYEVSKLTRRRVSPSGQVARLSIAVLIDEKRPAAATTAAAAAGAAPAAPAAQARTPTEVEQIQKLVAAAVGFDQARGDQITVEHIAFDAFNEALEVAPVAAPSVVTQIGDVWREQWVSILRGTAVFTLALFALFGVIRPMFRRAMVAAPAPARSAPLPALAGAPVPPKPERRLTSEELDGQIEAELDAKLPQEKRRLPVLSKRVGKLAEKEPEQLARVVRAWIDEDGR